MKKIGLPARNLLVYLGGNNQVRMAALLGATHGAIGGWVRNSDYNIQFYVADEYACRLGVHPSIIWGDAYWEAWTNIENIDEPEIPPRIMAERYGVTRSSWQKYRQAGEVPTRIIKGEHR